MHDKQRKKILLLWFMTYSLVGIVSIAGIMFSYAISSSMLKNNEIAANNTKLMRIRDDFDECISSLEQVVTHSGTNGELKQLSTYNGPMNSKMIYELQKLSKSINFYNDSLKSVQSAFFFFKQQQWVLALNSRSFPANDYYDIMGLDCTFVQWQEMMSTDTKSFVVPVRTKDGEPMLLYVSKNYYDRVFNNSDVSFCALLRLEDFEFLKADIRLIIAEKNSERYITTDNIGTMADVEFNLDSGEIKIDGKNYVYSSLDSDTWSAKYILLTSVEDLFSDFNKLQRLHFIIFFVLVILVGMLSYWFAQKNSRGWASIISLFGGQSFSFKGFDIFQKVEHGIEGLHRSYQRSLESGKNQLKKLKESYIIEMCVSNKKNKLFVENELREYGIEFVHPDYAVMIIYPHTEENFSLYFYGVRKIIQSVMGSRSEILIGERTCIIVCIFNFAVEGEINEIPFKVRQEAEAIIDIVREGISDRLGERVSFTISKPVDNLAKLSGAYNEALSEMDKLLTKEIDVENSAKVNVSSYIRNTAEREQMLIRSVLCGDEIAALQIVNDVFFDIKNINRTLENGLKCFVYDLICTLIRAASDMNTDARKYINDGRFLQRVEEIVLEREYKMLAIECVKGLCTIASREQKPSENKASKFEQRITEYIYEHYADYDLGLQKIADYMKMNAAYISVSFKEQCGEGISERIENYRMLKAIELLEAGEKVDDVAKKVGYQNVRTFSNVFKKKYNITPAKFRKM